MASAKQSVQDGRYTQGYSNYTLATQQQRTAASDAGFLLPYIKGTDTILDVGCGPGTITLDLARHANEGLTIGVDISADVVQSAKQLSTEAKVHAEGKGSLIFEQGNILTGLPYPDGTFDVVFASQVFGHWTERAHSLQALAEIRRLLKPGGIVATRDGAEQLFYPKSSNLDRLWVGNFRRAVLKGAPETEEPTGTIMPALFRAAGFDADGGKVRIGAGTRIFSGADARKRLAWRAHGQLSPGDVFHQSWLDAGISEAEIEETLGAVDKWAATDDAWFLAIQCEMLAWK